MISKTELDQGLIQNRTESAEFNEAAADSAATGSSPLPTEGFGRDSTPNAREAANAIRGGPAQVETGGSVMHRLADYDVTNAGSYAQQISFDKGPDAAKKAFFRSQIPSDLSGKTVLDVGGGDGGLGNEVLIPQGNAEAVINFDLFGYGSSSNRAPIETHPFVRKARAPGRSEMHVVAGDMQDLPIKTNSIDAAVCCYALHYAPGTDALHHIIAEVGRTLKPGGAFVLLTNTCRGHTGQPAPIGYPSGAMAKVRLSPEVLLHNRFFLEGDFVRALEDAGFEIVVTKRFGAADTIEGFVDANHDEFADQLEFNGVVIKAVLRRE